jgi:hypothetical protein
MGRCLGGHFNLGMGEVAADLMTLPTGSTTAEIPLLADNHTVGADSQLATVSKRRQSVRWLAEHPHDASRAR